MVRQRTKNTDRTPDIILGWLGGEISDDQFEESLGSFARFAVDRPDSELGKVAAEVWRVHGARLLEQAGWDGELYRRDSKYPAIVHFNLPRPQLGQMVETYGDPRQNQNRNPLNTER